MKRLNLILFVVLLIFTFISCKKSCGHTYDNACDVSCNECGEERTVSHDYTDDWQSDEKEHWHECTNEACNVIDNKVEHTPNQEEATIFGPKVCTICDHILAEKLPHDCSYTVEDKDSTHHWVECICGKIDESTKEPHNALSDNNCTTDDICACGYIVTEAKDHVVGKDDGKCTTAIKCANCDEIASLGKDNHNDKDHDYLCDNAGCQVTVDGAPKDENDGIDLPIDRN